MKAHWSNHSRHRLGVTRLGHHWRAAPVIAPVTGPFDVIENKTVLVIADEENLSIGARQLGREVSYATLAKRFIESASRCRLHAFFSQPRGDESRKHQLERDGWIAHARDIEAVRTHRGVVVRSNSDNLILFGAGLLASRSNADVVVLASGDGDLVSDLAVCLRSLARPRTVATLSLAGSTSTRLEARHNPYIAANIELGTDCLRPSCRLPRCFAGNSESL